MTPSISSWIPILKRHQLKDYIIANEDHENTFLNGDVVSVLGASAFVPTKLVQLGKTRPMKDQEDDRYLRGPSPSASFTDQFFPIESKG
jgi:hypothetical protein